MYLAHRIARQLVRVAHQTVKVRIERLLIDSAVREPKSMTHLMSQGSPLHALVCQVSVRICGLVAQRQNKVVTGQAVIVRIGIEEDFGIPCRT